MRAAKKKPQLRGLTLDKAMPQLTQLMRKPVHQVCVAVVDDDDEALAGIVPILLKWPNVFSSITVLKSEQYPNIVDGRENIVLLDEEMGKMTGTKIAEWLRNDGFTGIIASTVSTNACPAAFKHHFQHKYRIAKSISHARQFVVWLNNLIYELECDRME